MGKNALQAVLDAAAQSKPTPAAAPAPVAAPSAEGRAPRKPRARRQAALVSGAPAVKSEPAPFYRPSREGSQLIAGHFPKPVAKQLKLIAVEDDTTVQGLLEEALNLLFVKKGKQRIAEIIGSKD